MLDEYSAAVKLVDYGDYCMMQLENMQPLWPQFRHLSMQAISASLAGNILVYVGNDIFVICERHTVILFSLQLYFYPNENRYCCNTWRLDS